ncbi:DUF2017 family protein [Micrococcus luteus]
MAEGFRWTRRGYTARLEPAEARLLRGLFKDVETLLTGRREDAAEESAAPARDASSTAPGPGQEPTTAAADDASATGRPGTEAGEGSVPDDAFWFLVSGLSLGASTREAPTDPALLRLLPSAFGDPTSAGADADAGRAAQDAQRDAEHRADAEDLLIDAKLADARRARELLRSTEVRLDEQEAPAFGRALNDVRLVLSARLGIADEQDAARVHSVDNWKDAADEESAMALLYNFTSWFLETLMDQMLRGMPEDGREDVPGLEGPDAGEDRA